MSRIYGMIILILLTGCRQNQHPETKIREFSGTTIAIPEPMPLEKTDLFDSVRFLKLEATDSSLFGHVSKMKVYKDHIYILDRRYAKALLIFNKAGKHIRTIKNEGRGPREFVSIFNFEINYAKDEVVVMDNYGSKFGFFDLLGNYLRESPSRIDIVNAVVLPEGHIVHAKAANSFWEMGKPKGFDQLFYTTEQGEIIKSAFSYKDNPHMNIFNDNVISVNSAGKVMFAPVFKDTIYTLTFEEIVPRYALKFDEQVKISREMLLKGSKEDVYKLCRQGKCCFIGSYMETPSWLYLGINFWESFFPVFYSKKTGKSIAIKPPPGFNPADPLFSPMANEDDYFWSALDYVKIEQFQYDKIPMHKDTLAIGEDDNPWLICYKLKPF